MPKHQIDASTTAMTATTRQSLEEARSLDDMPLAYALAIREAWEEACSSHPELEGRDVELIA